MVEVRLRAGRTSGGLRIRIDTNYAAELDRRVEDARHNSAVPVRADRTYECNVDALVAEGAFRRTPEPPELAGIIPRSDGRDCRA